MPSIPNLNLAGKDVHVTVHDNGVAFMLLDRPAKRNAFSQVMINGMVQSLRALDGSVHVRVLVIAGSPTGPFCAGMDIKELVQISTAAAHRRNFLKDLTDAFAAFSKPIIAAVVGIALGGGCEIALACDIIYAAHDATFGLPEIKIGTIPGAGGTQRLARVLGKHKAMEFILTGDTATGAEFDRLGVVSAFPQEQVLGRALALAGRIASLSGPVVAVAKQAVLTAASSTLEMGMTHEKELYYATFDVQDCQEGLKAFIEKRDPVFKHE